MLKTALTKLLGIEVCVRFLLLTSLDGLQYLCRPLVQGGMQWVGYAEMASAVSNAGGLGIVRLSLYFWERTTKHG